jgi:hypothetical protein
VVLWEKQLRATLLYEFREFQRQCYIKLCTRDDLHVGFKLVGHRLRMDATNTDAFEDKKVNVVEVRTTLSPMPLSDDVVWDDIFMNLETKQILAPLAVMQGTNSAYGALGLLEDQMRGVKGKS